MRTMLVKLVALGLIVSACSSGEADNVETTTTTTAPSTTTSTEATTTTTMPIESLDVSPVNGLGVEDPDLLDRRVLGVKIDNHRRAIPQSGIQHADMVLEMMVEGITRFLTIWHHSDSEYLGPQRSGRPTDSMLMAAFNEPTFAISGAQGWVQNLIRSMDIHLIGEVRPATFRISGRSAPHNLYVNTELLREHADERGYPNEPLEGPIWEFGPMPESAQEATVIDIDFIGTRVVWTWDEESNLWLRSAYGQESYYLDEDGELQRIGFPVLVALYTEQYSHTRPGGGRGLPSSQTVGSGQVLVFAEGKVVEGTWERESEREWFTLTDADGEIIPVPPGQVWISLVPASRGLTYE